MRALNNGARSEEKVWGATSNGATPTGLTGSPSKTVVSPEHGSTSPQESRKNPSDEPGID